MKKGLLIILSGPSGVGKGTIRQKVMEDATLNLYYSVSLTTRPQRPGEVNGREYWFVSEKEFKANLAAGNLLEHASFVEHHYGTPKDQEEKMREEGKNVLLEIDIKGAKQVMEQIPEAVSIFLLPPSFEELEKRIRGRSTEGEKAIEERLEKARKEIAIAPSYTYRVVNDSLERATEDIRSIIRQEIARAN